MKQKRKRWSRGLKLLLILIFAGILTAGGINWFMIHQSKKDIETARQLALGYDEVSTMKAYAIKQGIPSEHIFKDHAGFSTYETMYRARDVFKAKSIVVVTQKYHLYRAVYDAKALGLEVKGISCDKAVYKGDKARKFGKPLQGSRILDIPQ